MCKLQKLFRAETGMQDAMESGEYPQAVHICLETKELLEDESMQRIDMLHNLRHSMRKASSKWCTTLSIWLVLASPYLGPPLCAPSHPGLRPGSLVLIANGV